MTEITPQSENITTDNQTKTVYEYFDNNGESQLVTKEIYKRTAKIIIHPYYANTRTNIIRRPKIQSINFIDWTSLAELPSDFKKSYGKSTYYGIFSRRLKKVLSIIYPKFPTLKNLVVIQDGRNRFSSHTIRIKWQDLEPILKAYQKEENYHQKNYKGLINNKFSELTSKYRYKERSIYYDELKGFIEKFDSFEKLSDSDLNSLSGLFDQLPRDKISVTSNFIETQDKINRAFLEDILKEFRKLMEYKSDNEKKWQDFFEKYSWIFSQLFPFDVILRQREAYVGGKTFENKDGKVVDFLYENGFRDNYALIEIKTHNKELLKPKTYRGTDVFAMSEELSGGINQCLNQKDNYIKEFGNKIKTFDPKCILLIGTKSELIEKQQECFELMRNNQKNVDIVTFDELQNKIEGLLKVISK